MLSTLIYRAPATLTVFKKVQVHKDLYVNILKHWSLEMLKTFQDSTQQPHLTLIYFLTAQRTTLCQKYIIIDENKNRMQNVEVVLQGLL